VWVTIDGWCCDGVREWVPIQWGVSEGKGDNGDGAGMRVATWAASAIRTIKEGESASVCK
jgi:hypothetical protein